VLHESEVCLEARRQSAILAEVVVAQVYRVGAPLRLKRRVGHDGFEAVVDVLWLFQRVFLPDVKLVVMHAVQDHVHARQVVGGAAEFLSASCTSLATRSSSEPEPQVGSYTDLSLVLPVVTSLASTLDTFWGV